MELTFAGPVVEWRGPAPYLFVRLPAEAAEQVREVASAATYGWGVVPVEATVGGTTFTTSLFPREGGYLLPVKVAVQRAERVGVDDELQVRLRVVLG